jgi:putative ABC transport system ATP-binding protein
VIQLEHASKIYHMGEEEIRALDDLSLDIENHEFVALVGPSGSGKSTLMNVVGALDPLTDGKILVDDTDLTTLSDSEKAQYRRKHVGFIFQTFNLQNQLSALENVELPLIFEGISSKKRRSMAAEVLEKMELSDRMLHRPSELSGGQQQRVAIARAIVNSPTILLADEPTGNLDSASGEHIMSLLRNLNTEDHVTILLVTHNEHFADYASRTLHMLDGKIIHDREKEQA